MYKRGLFGSFGDVEIGRRGKRVATAIEQLLVLQACDQEIRRLRREMQDIPRRQEQIEMRLTVQKENVERAEALLREKQAHIRNLAQESATNAERINAMIRDCGSEVESWIAEGTHAFDEPTSNGPMRHHPELTLEALRRFTAFLEDVAPDA